MGSGLFAPQMLRQGRLWNRRREAQETADGKAWGPEGELPAQGQVLVLVARAAAPRVSLAVEV